MVKHLHVHVKEPHSDVMYAVKGEQHQYTETYI